MKKTLFFIGPLQKIGKAEQSSADVKAEKSTQNKNSKWNLDAKCIRVSEQHRKNLFEILINSNATPIKKRVDQRYACFFCPLACPEPVDLKLHTLRYHNQNTIRIVVKDLNVYTVKLDITGLRCSICESDISTLEQLMEHLVEVHERTIYKDIKNQLVPFKFEGDELQCALCPTKCATFKGLTSHMNSHYNNFQCKVCGAGFINADILRNHVKIHQTGTYKCSLCPKTFDTLVKKKAHIYVTHKKSSRNRQCGYCDEVFNDYHKKISHLNEMHGEKLLTFKCDICGRIFRKHTLLKYHVRKAHSLQKEIQCEQCDMKFYDRKDLAKHTVKQTVERNYHCDTCGKAFRSRINLIRHLRVHEKELPKIKKHSPILFVPMDSDSETEFSNPLQRIKKAEMSSADMEDGKSTKKKNYRKNLDAECFLASEKHRKNLFEILINSNATPIKKRVDQGYMCFFCPLACPDPGDLKFHTLQDHGEDSIRKVVTDLRVYTVKLDITGLQCTICESDMISTLEQLVEHLVTAHERTIYKDIKNQLVPFKFKGDELRCALCPTKCASFKSLTSHMNVHYKNFKCKICGTGFINTDILRTHLNAVHRKLYNDHHKKNLRLSEIHGEKRSFKCDVCDKTFRKHAFLKYHIRRTHFLEKEHCDTKFLAHKDLTRHMVKHTGERKYRCDTCQKAFTRRFTLIQHLKIHIQERPKLENESPKLVTVDSGCESPPQKIGIAEKSSADMKAGKSIKKKNYRRDLDAECFRVTEKHRKNLFEILINSNATPIKKRVDQGYACFFCPLACPEPGDLKFHSLQDHDEDSIRKVVTDLKVYTVKLDITGLQCSICENDISTLEQLMEHLVAAHERIIYKDIKNQLVPFKFEGDELQCALCPTKCASFKSLTGHMNIHYNNFQCTVCGTGFINSEILRTHIKMHKTGTFQCDLCPKAFDTIVKKNSHIKAVHRKCKSYKCGYCNEVFYKHHEKVLHLNEKHGEKLVALKCDVCDRTFNQYTLLRTHIRKIHLLEKTVQCEHCDKKFFSRKYLTRHMLTHTGERNYRCDLCGKAFGRSFTLKQHMRVHTKERRKVKNESPKYAGSETE